MIVLPEYESFLKESKQVGILYHLVTFVKMFYIIEHDEIRSLNFQNISLTREKMLNNYIGGGHVLFKLEIDGDKLSERYKIEPFSYENKHGEHFEEFEECVKTNTIKKASKYINKIILIKENIENFKDTSYFEDKTTGGVWGNKGKSIPDVIKEVVEKSKFPVYVQSGSRIEKNEDYLKSLINYELKKVCFAFGVFVKKTMPHRTKKGIEIGYFPVDYENVNIKSFGDFEQAVVGYEYSDLTLFLNLSDCQEYSKKIKREYSEKETEDIEYKTYIFTFKYSSEDISTSTDKFVKLNSSKLKDIILVRE